jgi:enamine deaminase RidA (YjgF/YER057c/UK114 family)
MAENRRNVSSGSPWEPLVGYSRTVRAGRHVFVSGTTGVDQSGKPVAGGAYAQARRALEIILGALKDAGATAGDVVRTRIYVTDISDWQEIGRAHAEIFGDIRPATSMVEVRALIDPEIVVEIEADAVITGEG